MTSQIKVITPAFIDSPREGKKLWQVKDADGNRYGCADHIARGLQKGTAAKVEVESRDWQGKTYYNITKVLPPDQETQQAQKQHAKAEDDRSEHIFVAGVINNGISSGQISPTDGTALLAAVAAARYAWGMSFGTNAPNAERPAQQAGAALPDGRPAAPFDLNDEVPF